LVLVLGLGGGGVLELWRQAEAARGDAARARDDLAEEVRQKEAALAGEQEARQGEAAAREERDQISYIHRVRLAHDEWRLNNYARARELVQGADEPRRNWEWYHVNRLCHNDFLTLKGHTDEVHSVCFSPDGKRLASAGTERDAQGELVPAEVKVW